jgi:hypothetical protein
MAGVAAQSGSSLPNLGLIFDSAGKALRPVWGIPGSAFYGQRLDLGFPIASAIITPAQDAALVSSADGVYIVRFVNGSPVVQPGAGLASNPDLLVLSPRGSFGAAYYRDRQVISIVGLLSEQTTATSDVSAGLASAPQSLAISDDGRLAVALVSTGGDSPTTDVFTIDTQSGDTRRIFGTPHGAAVEFVPGTRNVVLADDVNGSVFLVRDVAGAAEQRTLITAEPRLAAPSGLHVSSDGKRVLAVSVTSGSLAMLDLAGADPAFLSCKCQPSEVRPLSGNILFQIAPLKDGVAWIVEWDPANPRILFIPPEIAYAAGMLIPGGIG